MHNLMQTAKVRKVQEQAELVQLWNGKEAKTGNLLN